jgi:hypothetical protein
MDKPTNTPLNSAWNDLFTAFTGESMCHACRGFVSPILGSHSPADFPFTGTTLDHSQGRLQMIDLFETQTDLLCSKGWAMLGRW